MKYNECSHEHYRNDFLVKFMMCFLKLQAPDIVSKSVPDERIDSYYSF